jgi:hypothetical protein
MVVSTSGYSCIRSEARQKIRAVQSRHNAQLAKLVKQSSSFHKVRNHNRRYLSMQDSIFQGEPSPDASPSRRDEQMKEKLQDLSDIPPNPPNTAGRSQTLSRVEIIATPAEASARRHHSWARGIGSSARLESVAHVENTVMDVYYRNDSMKSVGSDVRDAGLLNSMGWIWYSQSRVTRAHWIAKEKTFIHARGQPAHGCAWRVRVLRLQGRKAAAA